VSPYPQRSVFRQAAQDAAGAGTPSRNFLRFGARRVRMRLGMLDGAGATARQPPGMRPERPALAPRRGRGLEKT